MKVPGIPFVAGRNKYTDRDGKKYGIAIHNTSNDASDEGEASYATRRTDGVGSHFYADGDSVTQSIDTDYRTGHAGSYEGNEHAIAYELTGGNAMSREWWIKNIAWDKVAYTIAYQLKHDPDFVGFQIRRASVAEMKTNPKIKAFYGHNDMRLAWGGTLHTDPGPNFPWDVLIAAVKKAMAPAPTTAQPTPEVNMNSVILAREEGTAEVFIGDCITRRHIKDEDELAGVQYWVKKRGGDPTVQEFKPGTIGVLGVDVTPKA